MIRVDETDPVGEIEPSFPYRDVAVRHGVQFADQYDIESEIGRGKFGTVYRCKEKSSGLHLAAKVVNTNRKEDRRTVEREVEIMRRLQHPRLIQLYDAIATGNNIYVILELITGGELFERVIDDDFVLTERSCAVFMRQICEGIEFVHGQNILHLDLKPENILCLTKEGNRIKIIDFGLARKYDPNKKLQVLFGTPEFVAPEVVNFDQIGFGTDMWSIGVICYVLLSGLSPFMGDTDIETMANVTIAKYDFDDEAFAEISDEAKDFIKSLLVKDKGGRASASQCRAHAWLTRKSPPAPSPKIPSQPEVVPAKDSEIRNGVREELEVTKDNLRLFVERWREHPDSPYAVDAAFCPGCLRPEAADLGESLVGGLESISTRGQSPSPCGSLWSSGDSVNGDNTILLTVPGSGSRGAFDRRASEGTGTGAEKQRDPAAQIVLAEEIIKLSEHLRAIALGPRLAGTNVEGAAPRSPAVVVESASIGSHLEAGGRRKPSGVERSEEIRPAEPSPAARGNEISEKLSRIVRQRKTNGTAFGGVGKFANTKEGPVDVTPGFGPTTRKTRRPPERSDAILSEHQNTTASVKAAERTDSGWRTRAPLVRTSCFSSFNSSTISSSSSSSSPQNSRLQDDRTTDPMPIRVPPAVNAAKEVDLTPPWRRAKLHRFTESGRDVPRISNLRDLHRNLNLDEPTSTKNLLLQLLEEWDDGHTGTRQNGIGRKSVSLDWCGEESVARRSMNSLAEYFQSEQQKPPPVDPTPSVHR
ncbi:striated muscle preferentially expressed protein kinase-like isoform X1 [Neodiprion virginianus]|uniref:striated muscle preferentially expressed protein kinase-like isoform X1 n=2 Tax=Neodiprion virginianus TaxID=2961670 RepID=UPI001EE7287A|nr:striated muscle preferentially expressed protein kinase-like isoform X1 [Neodiprion virginianus]